MEPNNFEKHIREQLEQREIPPSAEAWGKVTSQLGSPSKQRPSSLFWYGIAASFVGFLAIYWMYHAAQEPNPNPGTPILVEDNENLGKEDLYKGAIDVHRFPESHIVDINDGLDSGQGLKDTLGPLNQQVVQTTAIKEPAQTSIALVKKEESEATENDIFSKDSEKIINAKISEIVAQVDALEQNNVTVSDAEVDSLLQQAHRELMAERLLMGTGKVDAMALLAEVEDELDQSFRDQIFEKLKTGFLRVRTAVADRNN